VRSKTVVTKAWLTQELPITVHEFQTLLQIMSYGSGFMRKLNAFFQKLDIENGLFPVKAEVPLKLSVKAVLMIQNFVPQ